jgi:hypothetical protein
MLAIKIPASQISSVSGRHKYVNRLDALYDVLYCYNHLNKYTQQEPPRVKANKIVDNLLANDELLNRYTELEQVQQSTQEQLQSHIQDKLVKTTIPQDQGVLEHISRVGNIKRGIVKECNVLDKLRILFPDVEIHSAPLYCLSSNFNINGIKLIVFGKYDALIPSDHGKKPNAVIEIKNRVNNFFISEYDLDQLATYVVLTNAKEGILVQQCNGELNITTYSKKEMIKRWLDIVHSLEPSLKLGAHIKEICLDQKKWTYPFDDSLNQDVEWFREKFSS